MTKWGSAYMPASYKKYQAEIAKGLPAKPADTPFAAELHVAIEFVCKPIAKSKFTTPMGDLDNFAKGVMDTLTDEGWWEDDRQIVSLHLTKRFPGPGESPHINVSITTI